jgi:signal transduction histidine kinase
VTRALSVVGIVLLAAGTAVVVADASPRAELWLGVAGMAVFLLATVLSRGSAPGVAARLTGAGTAALLVVSGVWRATERSGPRVLLLLVPVGLLLATAALALRDAEVQRRRARLRALRARLEGEEAERRRWVRELHDDTLQGLAAVQVLLGGSGGDPAAIATARDALTGQIRGLRRLIAQMRPLALDTLGLAAAVEDLASGVREATGLDVEVRVGELPPLPGDAETAVYRVVQEALTNAVRHAGAGRVVIEARRSGYRLAVTVRDNGSGRPDGFVPGHGLLGMRERAEALGARLRITGTEPRGTLVSLDFPLPASG